MIHCHRTTAACICAVASFLAAGCSRPGRTAPPRYPVSGSVSLDGTPLATGKIFFLTPSEGIIDAVPIRDGAFSGQAAAGDRRVEFSCVKDMPYKGPAMPGVQAPTTALAETLPRVFNAESTLKASVTPQGPNEFVFELKSR